MTSGRVSYSVRADTRLTCTENDEEEWVGVQLNGRAAGRGEDVSTGERVLTRFTTLKEELPVGRTTVTLRPGPPQVVGHLGVGLNGPSNRGEWSQYVHARPVHPSRPTESDREWETAVESGRRPSNWTCSARRTHGCSTPTGNSAVHSEVPTAVDTPGPVHRGDEDTGSGNRDPTITTVPLSVEQEKGCQ